MEQDSEKTSGTRVVYRGLAASPGKVWGRAILLPEFASTVPRRDLDGGEEELELGRLQDSLESSKNQLQELIQDRELAREHQAIFEAQMLLLEDPMLIDETRRIIQEDQVNCEWALASTLDRLKEMLNRTNDPIIRERVADLEDIGNRMIANLLGQDFDDVRIPFVQNLEENSVLVAESISPTLMLQLGHGVAGLVTEKGGVTGHTAILARDRGIPALVNTGPILERIVEGVTVFLDGDSGTLVTCPDEDDLQLFREYQLRVDEMIRKPVISPVHTADGTEVRLWTNLDNPGDASDERFRGLTGVGLFRTEFLYLRDPYLLNRPDDQKELYADILRRVGNKKVTFRLLDIGDDKNLHAPIYGIAGASTEYSRSLRGIRFLLANPGILAAQIQAIMEAAMEIGFDPTRCRIMIPMVSRLEEIHSVRDVMDMVQGSLERKYGKVAGRFPLGVMLETPAACLMADVFSSSVDFFSLGTNDLAQYTLAQRRTESRPDDNPFYQPALYRMIHEAVGRAKKTVSICGEIAGVPDLVPILLGLGIRDLSVSMASLPAVSDVIESEHLDRARNLAHRVLESTEVADLRSLLEK